MGCSRNQICVTVKNEDQALAFARIFAEVNHEKMYDEVEIDDVANYVFIVPKNNSCEVSIDDEPLYKYMDNNDNGLNAIMAFLKQYPEADLTAFLYESFNNCGEINTIDCVWDKEKKILHYECKSVDLADYDHVEDERGFYYEPDEYGILSKTKPYEVKDVPYDVLDD